LDDCPAGQFCFTSDDSMTGQCCTAACPFNTTPLGQTCNNCNGDEQFCHRVSGNNFAYAVCCERPCSNAEYENLYVGRKCEKADALNDECTDHLQCDGIATMWCAAKGDGSVTATGEATKTCQCRTVGNSQYVTKTDSFTSTINPAQECRNGNCSAQLSRDRECYNVVGLGEQCFIQEQCPLNSGCYRGRCMCRCGYNQNGRSCVLIPTTTQPPQTTQAGGSGTTKGGIGSLFGGGSGTSGQGLGSILSQLTSASGSGAGKGGLLGNLAGGFSSILSG